MRIHKTTLPLYFHMSEAVVDIWHCQHANCLVQRDTFCFIAGAQKLVVTGVQNMEPLNIAVQIILGTYSYSDCSNIRYNKQITYTC